MRDDEVREAYPLAAVEQDVEIERPGTVLLARQASSRPDLQAFQQPEKVERRQVSPADDDGIQEIGLWRPAHGRREV